MNSFSLEDHPHRRLNILNGEWVLVSPHRSKRPWKGKVEKADEEQRPPYDPGDYLGPGNQRANGESNPDYTATYAFTNDFGALQENVPDGSYNMEDLLVARSEKGICRVICFSPRLDLSLAEMDVADIVKVVETWKEEFVSLGEKPFIRYIQIFENKGSLMGCSNPHPHGQIWAQSSLPMEIQKEDARQKAYYNDHGQTLLHDYLALELKQRERVVLENEHFAVVVPFWAVWPYETMLVSRRAVPDITEFTQPETGAFAAIMKELLVRYDNLFETSFPYSAGMHQAPVNSGGQPWWHFHMHFYPPLLRSATVKKFMVGYEMLGEPQRDITPEWSAQRLRELSSEHYRKPVTD